MSKKDLSRALEAVAEAQRSSAAALEAISRALEAAEDSEGAQSPPLQLLTVKAAAARLGVSDWTIRDAIRGGRLEAVQVGSRKRIALTALADYLAKRAC
jgi:excisionase family DNA binding protein